MRPVAAAVVAVRDNTRHMLAEGIAAPRRLVVSSYTLAFAALRRCISPGPEFRALEARNV